jgi:hypothetical protein
MAAASTEKVTVGRRDGSSSSNSRREGSGIVRGENSGKGENSGSEGL